MYIDDCTLVGCPRNFPADDWRGIRQAISLTRAMKPGCVEPLYGYLATLYSIYRRWRLIGFSKKLARRISHKFAIDGRNAHRAAWTLVQSTHPDAGRKQHSRWTRVLEFAHQSDIPAKQFSSFLKANGGISGCAASAALRRRGFRKPLPIPLW